MNSLSLDLLGFIQTAGISVVKQFEESEFPNRKFSIYTFVSYFFSPYAVSCMVVAMALNRIRFIILQQFTNNNDREHNPQRQQQQQIRPRIRYMYNRNPELVFQMNPSYEQNLSYGAYIRWKYQSLITIIITKWQPFIKFMFRFTMVVILLFQLHTVLVAMNCYSPFFNKYVGSADSLFDLGDWFKFCIPTTIFTLKNGTDLVRPDFPSLAPMSKNLTKFVIENYENITIGSRTSILNYTTNSSSDIITASKSSLLPPPSFKFGKIGPSTSFLTTLFTMLCLSQIVESFCTCISGQSRLVSMSAMSIFEMSVNFHEFHQENVLTIASGVSSDDGLRVFEQPIAPTEEFLVLCMVLIFENITVHVSRMFNRPQWKLALSCVIHIPFCAYWLHSFHTGRQTAFPLFFILSCVSQIIHLFIISMSSLIYVLSWICSWGTSYSNETRSSSSIVSLNMGNLNLTGDSDDFLSLTSKLTMAALVSSVNRSYVRNVNYVCLRKDTWLVHELLRLQNEFKQKEESSETKGDKTNAKQEEQQPYSTEYATAPDLKRIEIEENSDRNSNEEQPRWRLARAVNGSGELLRIFMYFLYCIVFRNKEFKMKSEEERKELHKNDAHVDIDGEKVAHQDDNGVLFYEKINNGIDYKSLLEGKLAPDDDDDDDEYHIEDDEDYEEEEEQDDDEADEYDESVKKRNLLSELFNIDDFCKLLGLANNTTHGNGSNDVSLEILHNGDEINEDMMEFDESVKNIMKNHLSLDSNEPITRQQYKSIFNNKDKDEKPKSDVEKLASLLLEKSEEKQERISGGDEQENLAKQYTCAICQINPRQIILWPCKCLAICDECRVSLMVREFDRCVCCRRSIEGYSKIYIP